MVKISEVEEGSSSGSNNKRYDVFLSFRGADTRNNFTDHLYNALVDADITTFLDDEEIETGEDLKPELEDAIRSSKASVIVLSKNYATSTWCLDELALILDQRPNHIVIPIFYHVEPTHVRKQQNSFGDAMAEHRRKKMEAERNREKRERWGRKINQWKKALTDVGALKGKDVKDRKETEVIEEIVSEIRQRLGVFLSDTLPLRLIGRDDQIWEITSWLTNGSSSHTADILTVLGMGGIGKTSLAKYVFHLHSRTFDKSSFIEGINSTGLLDVQKQLYNDISKKKQRLGHDTWVNTSTIKKKLARVKVFLVLDDIGSLDQLDALLGDKGFHPGSKIIITTKDPSLTERCALFKSKVKPKHRKLLLEGLSEDASLELLCSNAFSCNTPKEGYEEVSIKVSKYCEGHPFTLNVLGKALYNRDVDEWEHYIEMLKRDPSIENVLLMSFNSLPENERELFKYIACFFVGEDSDYAGTILKACDINTRFGIRNLVDRGLLSIGWYNELRMHQLLQEMGRDVVRKESPEKPWKRSRLWNHDESYEVLKKNKKDMDKIRGLTLDTRFLKKEKLRGSFEVKTDVLSKMENIMLLQLNYVQIKGTYKKFPEELRWLRMHGFPLKSIPSDLALDNLVALDLSYSSIESFGMCWSNPQKVIGSCSKDKRVFGSLKILDLSFCEQLQKLGGFYQLPTLERLIASNCKRLIEVCESLGECAELVHIDLSYCIKLEKLPTAIHKLKKDCKILLDGCNTCKSILRQMVSSVISFPSSLGKLSLKNNNLSNESFPMDLSRLSGLKYLWLDGNPIDSMPDCVRSLCSLEELSMYDCYSLVSIEHPPCTLRRLNFQTLHCVAAKPLLDRISFHPDMSPVSVEASCNSLRPWSYEIQGMVKIQPLEDVEKKVLCSLGWSNLDFIDKRQEVVTYDYWRRPEESHIIQMYYEFGIFSTFYGGEVMPDWIKSTISSQKAPISFTIPSSPKKQLRGLNFCYVLRKGDCGLKSTWYINNPRSRRDLFFDLPVISISNKTKNLTWVYEHCIHDVNVGGEWLTFISHWMFGMNEMEAGDKIIITVTDRWARCLLTNCGVNLVYDHGSMEEDALEYYKSWNHIIGGDLSSFQLTTGEYILRHSGFRRQREHCSLRFPGRCTDQYKENTVLFRAFSERKSPTDNPLFGMNEMEAGDDIIITLEREDVEEGRAYEDGVGLQGLEFIVWLGDFTTFYENDQGDKEKTTPFRAFSKRKSPTDNPLLQRISFDPDTSPINVTLFSNSFRPWSCEIEGKVKIQPLEGVEEKVLCSLGWTNLSDFLDKSLVATSDTDRGKEQYQIQMYYEFGVFSTIYGGQAMPDWIRFKRSQTPISFTIPSSPNKQLKGLNFCYVQRRKWYGENSPTHPYFRLPAIEISNKTKNLTWVYKHCIKEVNVGGEWLTFISHWMFGMNEMEVGDNIIITLEREDVEDALEHAPLCCIFPFSCLDGLIYLPFKKKREDVEEGCAYECGVGFVYEDEDGRMEDEQDALEYYKSWNHIIGGDLSAFQSTTGEYILCHEEFTKKKTDPFRDFSRMKSPMSPSNKSETDPFRDFSKMKSPMSPSNKSDSSYESETDPFRDFSKMKSLMSPSNKAESSNKAECASQLGFKLMRQRAVYGSSSNSL